MSQKEDDDDAPPQDATSPPSSSPSSSESIQNKQEIIKKKTKSTTSTNNHQSYLTSALQTKESPLQISSWIKLSSTLDGRDKITKIIQYSCRFLVWYHHSSSSGSGGEQLKSLQKSLTDSRKAYRLGRSLNEIWKLWCLLFDDDDDDWKTWWLNIMKREDERSSSGRNVEEEMRGKKKTGGNNNMGGMMNYYQPSPTMMITTNKPKTINKQHWKTILSAIKIITLSCFFLGDNLTYLYSSGFLCDDKNKRNKTRASKFAVRSYFISSAVSLVLNSKACIRHFYDKVRKLTEEVERKTILLVGDDGDDEIDDAGNEAELVRLRKKLEEVKCKQFTLFLAVLKSACDVLVFSNNPGVDLHKRYRGRKMNEGLHSVLGLISAGTVIYNNFPNKK